MVVVRGRLSPEVGAVVRRALEAACDQARGEDAPDRNGGAEDAASGEVAETSEPSLAQRQAVPWEWSRSAPCQAGSTGGRRATGIRWWYTWTRTP